MHFFLTTCISSCKTAQAMCNSNQSVSLTLHIKNKLKGRADELVNSRNPSSWDEMKVSLGNHFKDSRDLSSLIQYVQRMRQLPNEFEFTARLQTHETSKNLFFIYDASNTYKLPIDLTFAENFIIIAQKKS